MVAVGGNGAHCRVAATMAHGDEGFPSAMSEATDASFWRLEVQSAPPQVASVASNREEKATKVSEINQH